MADRGAHRGANQDALTGLMFFLIGAFGTVYATGFEFGTLSRMGPGFFPLCVSVGLAATGLAIGGRALIQSAGERVEIGTLRPLLLILGSVVLFGLIVDIVGLVLAVIATIVLARLADTAFRPLPTLLLSIGMAALCVVVFRHGLGLPFMVWPL